MSPDESNEQRERLARELAYEEGRRREQVDGRLNSHEARLNAINGSIDHQVRESRELRKSVDSLREELQTKKAVEEALHKAIMVANEKQISTRTFLVGVLAILLPVVALFLTAGHAL